MNRHATNLLIEHLNQQIVDSINSVDFVLKSCTDPTIESALDSYRDALNVAFSKGIDARLTIKELEI